MKVEEKGHTLIIKDTACDVDAMLENVLRDGKKFEASNLVIDISGCKNVTMKTISKFVPLAKSHRKNKKSFVIVASNIDFNAVPSSITVVPSQLEAHDIIEMEEIERDLGF